MVCTAVAMRQFDFHWNFIFDLASVFIGHSCETRENHGYCMKLESCAALRYSNISEIMKYRCNRRDGRIVSEKMHICCPIEEIFRMLLPNERKPLVPLSNYIGYGVKSHMYEFPWLAKLQYRSGKCDVCRIFTLRVVKAFKPDRKN